MHFFLAATPGRNHVNHLNARPRAATVAIFVSGILALWAAIGSPAAAQTTWTWTGGGGDGNWANGANWTYNSGTIADPLTGQSLTFAGVTQVSTTNNTTANGTAGRMAFSAGAGAFTLAGNALTLSGNITNNAVGNAQTISLPLNLTAATHVLTTATGGTTVLSGNLTGGNAAGSTTISSTAGVLVLSGSNSFTGNVTVNGGTLAIGHANALSSGTLRLFATAPVVRATTDLSLANNVYMNTGSITFDGANSLGFGEAVQNGGNRTVTNTIASGKSLTFSGTVYLQESTATAGRNLTLAGSGNTRFNGPLVNGGVSGTSGLIITNTGTTTFGAASAYTGTTAMRTGATVVLGTSGAIPSSSPVTLDSATLAVGSAANPIGSLTTAGISTIEVSINGAGSGSLSMGNLVLGGTTTLAVSMTSPTAGIYNLLSYSGGKTGTIAATGLDPNYTLLQGAASNGAVAVQRKAEFGAVSAAPAVASIITGGSAAISYTAANATPVGGATLAFASTTGANVSGASGGSALASGTSSTVTGLFFTGTAIGANQAGLFSLTDASAINSGSGSVSVTVLDHATSSLAGSLLTSATINLGTWNTSSAAWDSGNGTGLFSIFNLASAAGASLTAEMALLGITGSASGFSTNLAGYTDLAGGQSQPFTISFDTTSVAGQGLQSTVFQLAMGDKTSLSGATASNTLLVTANVIVVPEPVSTALPTCGIAWLIWRGRRRLVVWRAGTQLG